ncbi:hypothetical protein Dda3937_04633 [Dickeya dadantii 3937]|uniref:Uncharacterized protein n=1 Tax=Dickeya dadantii (strain 3937) TaxID=198628 RepID=E0SIL9_DICD3|nr:hypothetical protein Dda3937_04633 [Dickeya dadantii 3937]
MSGHRGVRYVDVYGRACPDRKFLRPVLCNKINSRLFSPFFYPSRFAGFVMLAVYNFMSASINRSGCSGRR